MPTSCRQDASPQATTAFDVACSGVQRAWAVGALGFVPSENLIVATSDAGVTWTRQRVPPGTGLAGVFFGDERHGWAVGSDMNENGLIVGTTDGGATWTRQPCGRVPVLWDVVFCDTRP